MKLVKRSGGFLCVCGVWKDFECVFPEEVLREEVEDEGRSFPLQVLEGKVVSEAWFLS